MVFLERARELDRAYDPGNRNIRINSRKCDWLGNEKQQAAFLVFAHNSWPEILALVEAARLATGSSHRGETCEWSCETHAITRALEALDRKAGE